MQNCWNIQIVADKNVWDQSEFTAMNTEQMQSYSLFLFSASFLLSFFFFHSIANIFYIIPNNNKKWIFFSQFLCICVCADLLYKTISHVRRTGMNKYESHKNRISKSVRFQKLTHFKCGKVPQHYVYISRNTGKFKQMIKQQCNFANISKCRRKINVYCVYVCIYVSGCFSAFGHFVPCILLKYTKKQTRGKENYLLKIYDVCRHN